MNNEQKLDYFKYHKISAVYQSSAKGKGYRPVCRKHFMNSIYYNSERLAEVAGKQVIINLQRNVSQSKGAQHA